MLGDETGHERGTLLLLQELCGGESEWLGLDLVRGMWCDELGG